MRKLPNQIRSGLRGLPRRQQRAIQADLNADFESGAYQSAYERAAAISPPLAIQLFEYVMKSLDENQFYLDGARFARQAGKGPITRLLYQRVAQQFYQKQIDADLNAGKFGDAVSTAREQGGAEAAARIFAELGAPVWAADCFLEAAQLAEKLGDERLADRLWRGTLIDIKKVEYEKVEYFLK
ncbi:MAG: hypothetical protein AABX13_06025 [Nanoarchaeota archaeon]